MKIGDSVRVITNNSDTTFDGLSTYGLSGCVSMLDDKAGVCVRLYISTLFSPCFWYPRGYLMQLSDVPDCSLALIEAAYGRSQGSGLVRSKIAEGVLRSWVVTKTRAEPGQEFYSIIERLAWIDLVMLWNGSTASFAAWLEANDKRIRRPRILNSVTIIESNSIVRRSRVGG